LFDPKSPIKWLCNPAILPYNANVIASAKIIENYYASSAQHKTDYNAFSRSHTPKFFPLRCFKRLCLAAIQHSPLLPYRLANTQ